MATTSSCGRRSASYEPTTTTAAPTVGRRSTCAVIRPSTSGRATRSDVQPPGQSSAAQTNSSPTCPSARQAGVGRPDAGSVAGRELTGHQPHPVAGLTRRAADETALERVVEQSGVGRHARLRPQPTSTYATGSRWKPPGAASAISVSASYSSALSSPCTTASDAVQRRRVAQGHGDRAVDADVGASRPAV